MITGKQLIEWGYSPFTYFKDALPAANAVAEAGGDIAAIRSAVDEFVPPPTIPLVVSRIFRTFDFVRGLRGLVSSGQAVVQ